jgi:hypothetical protein
LPKEATRVNRAASGRISPASSPSFRASTPADPASARGWYSFPGLAPGSYYVCVTPPPTFVFTIPNAGAASASSVANQKSGCSPLVTLAANQQNLNVDFGLLATRLSALGDYAWFDRNGDGVQNESTWDGANGVTVKLWADNGNGIAEPGTGDALVATTLTADDSFGRPGYYRFDGLIPGVSYFVQFVLPPAATAFTTRHAGADATVDSDADPAAGVTQGVTQMVVLAPGEYNSTLDAGLVTPTGPLAIGDQVWLDGNNNGLFEPQGGEAGINGVRLDLYLDANGDGLPNAGELAGTTLTDTLSGSPAATPSPAWRLASTSWSSIRATSAAADRSPAWRRAPATIRRPVLTAAPTAWTRASPSAR